MAFNPEQNRCILPPQQQNEAMKEAVLETRNMVEARLNGGFSIQENLNKALGHFAVSTTDVNNDEQEKAKDPNKITKREQSEIIIEQLKKGELPPLLAESWRIVDPSSSEGQEFQQRVQELAEQLYRPEPNKAHLPNYELSHHDFGAEPVRFLLSDEDEPNAWYVKHTNPPIIVFTKGLFKEQPPRKEEEGQAKKGEGLWFVRSPHDFAAVVGHEMTHLKLRTLYGEIPNSKLEEGVAYSLPLVIMREKSEMLGLNPERCQDILMTDGIFETIKKNNENAKGPFRDLKKYMDVHPTAENTYSIATNTLAYLRKEKGDIPNHVNQLPTFSPDDPLIQVIERSHHVSYLERELSKHPEYRTGSFAEKTKVIQTVIEKMADVYHIRVVDLVNEIKTLQGTVDLKGNREAADNLANAVLHMGLIHTAEAHSLYSAASRAAGESMKPLGRLRTVNTAIRKFVRAIEKFNGNKEPVAKAAKLLNQALESEPLVKSTKGRLLLQQIDFSHFTFPNENEIFDVENEEIEDEEYDYEQNRRYEDYDRDDEEEDDWGHRRNGNYYEYRDDDKDEWQDDEDIEDDETERVARKKVLPSWHPLRELAVNDEDIARAAGYLGMGYDPLVLRGIFNHQNLVMDFCSPQLNVSRMADMLPVISGGPHDPEATNRGLKDLQFDSEGALVHHSEVRLGSEKEMFREFEEHISAWANHIFLESQGTGTPSERLRMLKRFWNKDLFFLNEHPLCLNVCEHDMNLFLELNKDGLAGNRKQAEALIGHLRILVAKNANQYGPIVRHLFMSEAGKDIVVRSLTGNMGETLGFVKKLDKYEMEKAGYEKEQFKKNNIVYPNAYINFVCREGSSVFTPQERMILLDEFLAKSRYFQDASGEFDTTMAQAYMRPLSAAAKEAGCMYTLKPKKWDSLLACLGALHNLDQSFNIMKSLLYCEAILMIERNTPTLDQSASFAQLMGPEKVGYTNLQHKIRKALEEEALEFPARIRSATDVLQVARQWKALSAAGLMFPEQANAALEALVERLQAIGIETPEAAQASVDMSELLLSGERVQNPQARNRIVDIWACALLKLHGIDSKQPEYSEKALEITERILAKVNRIDQSTMLNALSKRLQTQHSLSIEMQRRMYRLSESDKENLPMFGTIADVSIQEIRKRADYRKETVLFLTAPLTEASCHRFIHQVDSLKFVTAGGQTFTLNEAELSGEEDEKKPKKEDDTKVFRERLAYQGARDFYQNFWAAPLEIRAVLVREMLVSPESSGANVDNETFNFVIERTFPTNAEHTDKARHFIRAYVDALPYYQKHLCMGAMMAASEKTGGSEKVRIGESLAFFLESMGPAETKVGQAAQSHPFVPADIREDLRRLKFHANEPNRWEVTEWVEQVRPDLERQYNERKGNGSNAHISHVGDVIGSGSIYVVADLYMSDGTNFVLSLLRPDALNRGKTGFSTLRRMADNLELNESGASNTVRELIHQASDRLDIEVYCQLAPLQYGNARDIYSESGATMNGIQYRFSSPDVIASGNAYFLMTKIHGDHYIELPEGNGSETAEMKAYAMVILTFELNNKLRGRFDCDRHGGNVKIQRDKREIGHVDFKSMALNEWSEEGYGQFARLLMSTLGGEKTVRQFFNDLLEQERLLREELHDSGKQLDPYVMEVQKGLLTDGEYTQMLDRNDLMRVIISALLNGLHPQMQQALLSEITNKISTHLRPIYDDLVHPALRHALQKGKLVPQLEQFLPVKMKDEDVIRIQRS